MTIKPIPNVEKPQVFLVSIIKMMFVEWPK